MLLDVFEIMILGVVLEDVVPVEDFTEELEGLLVLKVLEHVLEDEEVTETAFLATRETVGKSELPIPMTLLVCLPKISRLSRRSCRLGLIRRPTERNLVSLLKSLRLIFLGCGVARRIM